ncbi:hypothetical protein DM02DRAFT_516277 [Periconia macrospinosa]|uniref:Uncharacterized protein n=1 Tax=Periconia macrospinosa TaxID=97972 RepID=A0A2V1E7D9_9PLEO|nr:hypothetical protein DM02DRAFT_516277 [Periconia macrospinosa]
MENLASGTKDEDPYSDSKASKFEFKSKSERRSKTRHRKHDRDDGEGDATKRHHSRERDSSRHRHRDSKRRRKHRSHHHDRTFTRNGAYENPDHRHRESMYDGLNPGEADSSQLDPDAAFRESLFDAMADDEGAAYWEGVYGQPLHIYPNTKPGPNGELERMTDEEYAEHVRVKMWEKSHQHILEERAAKERLRKKQKESRHVLEEEVAQEERERDKIRREVEESLKRGEERRRMKEAEKYWTEYLSRWDQLKSNMPKVDTAEQAREMIPWPVASGKLRHLNGDEIEKFLRASSAWKRDAAALLKIERVRWHPDKMQQRFGQHIDPDTMKSVTAVFQVVDRLWNENSERRV